jgi:hypothetical protein
MLTVGSHPVKTGDGGLDGGSTASDGRDEVKSSILCILTPSASAPIIGGNT